MVSQIWLQKHMKPKRKLINQTLPKLKYLNTKKKTERQPTWWEEVITNHVSEESLVCRICKEFLQLKN